MSFHEGRERYSAYYERTTPLCTSGLHRLPRRGLRRWIADVWRGLLGRVA